MKRISLLTLVVFICWGATAFAGQITTGQTASCENANEIVLEVAKISPTYNSNNFGHTNNDRGTANLVVWKSANFTTIPITLGPNDSNQSLISDKGHETGVPSKGTMGKSSVTLTHQPKFSRGDSIGDISGLVKITNTGTNPVTVTCK